MIKNIVAWLLNVVGFIASFLYLGMEWFEESEYSNDEPAKTFVEYVKRKFVKSSLFVLGAIIKGLVAVNNMMFDWLYSESSK